MNHDSYSDDYIADILGAARVFAFVGASANTSRPSYFAMKYLSARATRSSRSIPASPARRSSARRSTRALADVPAPVDVVDIFRNSRSRARDHARGDRAEGQARPQGRLDAARRAQRRGGAPRPRPPGLRVVMNRCPKIEYGRLSGEIGWAGVNSGTISSLRPKLAAHGVQSHVLTRRR